MESATLTRRFVMNAPRLAGSGVQASAVSVHNSFDIVHSKAIMYFVEAVESIK